VRPLFDVTFLSGFPSFFPKISAGRARQSLSSLYYMQQFARSKPRSRGPEERARHTERRKNRCPYEPFFVSLYSVCGIRYAETVPSMPYLDRIESTVNIALAIKINKNQHCSYATNETLVMNQAGQEFARSRYCAQGWVQLHIMGERPLSSSWGH
jgi:hypothetical protein